VLTAIKCAKSYFFILQCIKIAFSAPVARDREAPKA